MKETFLFLTQNIFGYALGSSFAVNNKERKKKNLFMHSLVDSSKSKRENESEQKNIL